MGLTVGGFPINAEQRRVATIGLGVAQQLGAGSIASVSLIYAGMGESNLSANNTWQSNNPSDTQTEATQFLQGTGDFGNGGAIALARLGASPVAIANAVEVNAVYIRSGGSSTHFVPGTADSYGGHLGGTDNALAEAKAIVAALGGGTLKGGIAGASSGGSGTVPNSSATTTYAFAISSSGNPDEDYWTGINRLAQEVNWYLFSSGEYLYYLDGQEMLAQQPAAHIDRVGDAARIYENQGSLTYDNTAYSYVSDHKRRFRTQRRTKVALAQSPTEGIFELICGIDEILGGDVVVLSGFGPGDGRWVVGECRRSVFQIYSELTLVPALAPITEAAAAGTTGKSAPASLPGTGPGKLTGTYRNKVVQVALAAIARQSSSHAFNYGQVRPYPSSLSGPAPVVTDCSGFSILCYKDAGAPDPNGTGFDGSGSTYTLITKGAAVQTPQPGDLVFYNVAGDTQAPPNHVAVYIGNSQVANMGSQGDPTRQPLNLAPIYAIRSYL